MALSRTTRVNLLIGTGHFLSHFYVLCLPPMFLIWQRQFHVTFAQVGLTVALLSGTTALLQTPVGFMVDKHGARRFLIGGAFLMSVSIAMMGFATQFWQILVLAVLSGIGNSVIHPADYAILAGSIQPERMGRAFGLHTFAGNLGFAAGAPGIAFLTLALGWREALSIVGFTGVLAVGAIILQSRILVEGVDPKKKKAHSGGGRALLLSRPMLMFFVFYMLGAMASAGVQSWLITVLHTVKGMDIATASGALTAFMVGTTGGVLIGGWIADGWKQHLMSLVVGMTLIAVTLLLAVNLLSLPVVATIALMMAAGLTIGISRTPRDVMLKDTVPASEMGKVFGFVSSGLPLGSALTPVPFGFLIDRGHPELVLALVATLLLASLVCAMAARASARRHAAMLAEAAD